MTLSPGIHRGVPMSVYQADPSLGSGRLRDLSVSPLRYRHSLTEPREETDAMRLGSLVHVAALEPELFAATCTAEPDLAALCPGAVKPRATKAYSEWSKGVEADGKTILRAEQVQTVCDMAAAIRAHPQAARLLERAPEREVSFIWERDDRRCRGRADMLGELVLADVKVTRDLRRFSPWVVSDLKYHVQAGWYVQGLEALGHKIAHVFFIAIETRPPYDIGCFTLDPFALRVGQNECDVLLERLGECEATDSWPGMYPTIQTATISDQLAAMYGEEEVA
jgi:hypothetical protein